MICYDGYRQDMSANNRRNNTHKDKKNMKKIQAAAAFGNQIYEMLEHDDDADNDQQPELIHAHRVSFEDDQPAAKKQKSNIHDRIRAAKESMTQNKIQESQNKFNTAYQAMAKFNSN